VGKKLKFFQSAITGHLVFLKFAMPIFCALLRRLFRRQARTKRKQAICVDASAIKEMTSVLLLIGCYDLDVEAIVAQRPFEHPIAGE
jgi:hypothetical protein